MAHVTGVIRLLDWTLLENGLRYALAMERPLNSISFKEFRNKQTGRRFDEKLAQNLFCQMVETVTACHYAGVIHRDLKESNFLICETTMTLKLIDFGYSAHMNTTSTGTIFNQFSGTLKCAPPEWFQTKQYKGVDAEIWTLGVLLYRMIFGVHPFKNVKEISNANVMLKENKPFPSVECQDLICKCLALNPRNRPTLENIKRHPWLNIVSK